jgi:hypothetical protein
MTEMCTFLVVTAKEVEAKSLQEAVEKYKSPENVAYVDLNRPGGIAQERFIELMAVSFPALGGEEDRTDPWPNRGTSWLATA